MGVMMDLWGDVGLVMEVVPDWLLGVVIVDESETAGIFRLLEDVFGVEIELVVGVVLV